MKSSSTDRGSVELRVRRAKVLLMQHCGLDEPAAHRLLLRAAMERNLKLGEAAALVIRLLGAADEDRSV